MNGTGPQMKKLLERARAYLAGLEADRQTALALSEQKAEEAKLIKARQEGFQAALALLGETSAGNDALIVFPRPYSRTNQDRRNVILRFPQGAQALLRRGGPMPRSPAGRHTAAHPPLRPPGTAEPCRVAPGDAVALGKFQRPDRGSEVCTRLTSGGDEIRTLGPPSMESSAVGDGAWRRTPPAPLPVWRLSPRPARGILLVITAFTKKIRGRRGDVTA